VKDKGRYEVVFQQYPEEEKKPYCLSCSNPLYIKDGKLQVTKP